MVKKPINMAWHKRILDRKKPSKALRSWNGTAELMRREIETPRTVAYFESKDSTDMMNNWFVCEYMDGGLSVRNFWAGFATDEIEVYGFTFEVFCEKLIDFIIKCIDGGVLFRDLSGGNVLVQVEPEQSLKFSLIDTARARCNPWGVEIPDRISDLKRLVLKLRPDQQVEFMDKYLGRLGGSFGLKYRFEFKLYALKTDLKRLKRRLIRKFR